MKIYGVDVAEGSKITNATIANGTSFPDNPNEGELFWRSDQNKLYIYDEGTTAWLTSAGILNVVDDTTPQLGGDLDVNGHQITSASNGNIVIVPHGTGNVGFGEVTIPGFKFHVGNTQTETAAIPHYSHWFQTTVQPLSTSSGGHVGLISNISSAGTQTLANNLTGLEGKVTHSGTGTLYLARGIMGGVQAEDQSGTISHAYALHALAPGAYGSGSIGTAYGLFINAQKTTGVTTGYGVYQNGSDDINYFAGKARFSKSVEVNYGDGTASAAYQFSVQNGTSYVRLVPKAPVDSYNGLTVEGDSVLYFSAGTEGTGALCIVPWHGGVNSGVRINSAGYVGIGTNNPTSTLHVVGAANITGGITAGNTTINDGSIEINSYGTGNRYAYIDFHGDDTYTDYSYRILRNNTGANAVTLHTHRGTGALEFLALEAAPIRFLTDNTSRMTVEADGTVSVNTTDYETLVTADDDIPNKKYVDDAIVNLAIAMAIALG